MAKKENEKIEEKKKKDESEEQITLGYSFITKLFQ